ncbi:hypothetical protein FG386_001437 [Cryptosporidium ryanae]|uniref:uncharacterized protein n=1 Tax=Cryptosporidium ryanae TaxID=515981 RepID=UPI00351A3238|nr:hypothetical protein FG386_001437 [Cryptosporidium ryanae]
MEECTELGGEERLRLEIEALRCIFTESVGELVFDDEAVSWIVDRDKSSFASKDRVSFRARLDSRDFYSTQLFLELTVDPKTHYEVGPIELKVVSGEASPPFFLSDSQCSYIVDESKKAFVPDSECIYDQIIAAREATELVVRDLPADNICLCPDKDAKGAESDDGDNGFFPSDEELEQDIIQGGFRPPTNTSKNGMPRTITWGMRACYSHHIRSKIKIKLIHDWADELSLGGFCKIGYPGIIIVEGPEECCLEYTRRLQRLRWKHFVVRGEIIQELDTRFNKEGEIDLDCMRKLPCKMIELPPEQMKTLAMYCNELGIKDLFLTTMKIYSK